LRIHDVDVRAEPAQDEIEGAGIEVSHTVEDMGPTNNNFGLRRMLSNKIDDLDDRIVLNVKCRRDRHGTRRARQQIFQLLFAVVEKVDEVDVKSSSLKKAREITDAKRRRLENIEPWLSSGGLR
jgi:hypothetical protein